MNTITHPSRTLLFSERKSYEECANSWCLSKNGDLGRVKDWMSTSYWGERVLLVYWYDSEKKYSYASSATPETHLFPIDVDHPSWKDFQSLIQQSYLADLQKKSLNQELPKAIKQSSLPPPKIRL